MKYYLFFLIVLLFSGCSKDHNSEKFIVGLSAQYPPLTFIENDKFKGFDVDLVNIIAKKLNKRVEFKDMQFQALFPAVDSRKIDFAMGCISITKEREKNFDFSIPYHYEKIGAIFRMSINSMSLANFQDKKIGVQFGNTIVNWARSHFNDNNIVQMDNMSQLIEALKNKYLDLVLTSSSHAVEFSTRNPELSWMEVGENNEGCGFLFRKHSNLVKQIDRILEDMIKNGEIENLERLWHLRN